ncbi:MAG: hypothetical protein EOP24_26305 [Hyphomicrobiales bacterium]|nr:MAG: hypothetical protein EOP24_26305 [Hyphomicrobiales bacterium]
METVEVEILTQTVTAQYGVLSQGDILRTSPEFAKHLVEDASAAKYTKAKAKKDEPTEAELQKLAAAAVEDTKSKKK